MTTRLLVGDLGALGPQFGGWSRRGQVAVGLEFLTKSCDVSPGDDAGGEAEEGFVDVVAAFPADA